MRQEQLQSMKKEWSISRQRGFSGMEVLLSATVFTMLVTALVGVYIYGEESTSLAGSRARAVMLADEGLEAVRNIRDAGFSNIPDGTYGLTTTGNQWNLSGSSDISDIFTRSVTITTEGVNKKSVLSEVSWQQNAQRTGTVSLTTRLNNWIRTGVGNWAIPIQTDSLNVSGNNDGRKVQIEGNYAYVVRTDGTPDFLIIDITDPANSVISGSLSLAGTPTNIAVSGNYAYVSNIDNASEMQIINISNKSAPVLAGVFNATGNADGSGVYISGNNAYLVRANSGDNEFVIINVTAPNLPVLVGSLDLGSNGNEVVVSGNYAYVATSDNSQEMKVVNISVPGTPVLAGTGTNLAGNTDAITISYANSKIFLGQGNNFNILNVTNPLAPSAVGVLNAGGLLNDIALNLGNSNSYVYVGTSENAREFKVINITVPAVPVMLGFVNMTGNNTLSGVAYSPTLDRAFGVSNSNTEEFVVFAPQ